MDKNDFLQDYAVKVLIIWNYFACYNTTMAPSCILQKKKIILKEEEIWCLKK